MAESGFRPLVPNSLLNVTFEAEDSSPALVPISLDDNENDQGNEEIKSDIAMSLPPKFVPLHPVNNFERNEIESPISGSGDFEPIDVFRKSATSGVPDPFASDLLNKEPAVSYISGFGQNTGGADFFNNLPLATAINQQSPFNYQPNGVLHSSSSAGLASSNSTQTIYNPASYMDSSNTPNNYPPPMESFLENPSLTGVSDLPIENKQPLGCVGSTPYPPAAPPPTGTENCFRLTSHKPVYAKYPGLTSDSAANQQFLPPAPVNMAPGMDPTHRSYYAAESGPGYSFGEPIPSSHSFQHLPPVVYRPVNFHWFSKVDGEGRSVWKPFSFVDSIALENGNVTDPDKLVATEGGRCDVNIKARTKKAVYWEEDSQTEVRRSSWFYKGPMDSRFIPYDEDFSQRLENAYEQATTTGEWHKRLDLEKGEAIILQSATSMVHFCQAASPDEWGNLPESQLRPRVVKRGVEEFEIEIGEPEQVDHLVFLVHGIGAICDFKFRSITEAVDDFRSLSVQLTQTHFSNSIEAGKVGRIEFLPISWHKPLHADGGIDKKLKPITLPSIPKLRHFTNDTLLDILFYTSPVYCQTIVDTVSNEMNRMYNIFLERHKTFNGKVGIGGHSLGSVICFDILAHQPKPPESVGLRSPQETTALNGIPATFGSKATRTPSYTVVSGGTGQPYINYPPLNFHPSAFFAMGSPTAMFVTVRGLDELGANFEFPTCPAFYNIFHPYDPVAYRMESLIDRAIDLPPVVIPHHKGRKRFHLELRDTVTRVGADLKNKLLGSFRTTWNSLIRPVSQLTQFGRSEQSVQADNPTMPPFGGDTNQVQAYDNFGTIDSVSPSPSPEQDVRIGRLNRGRRIDYVLQEAPVEILNEYLFALTSHACYWESEDVSLFLVRELYATLDIFEDRDVLRQSPVLGVSTSDSDYPIPIYSNPVPPSVDNAPLMLPVGTYSSVPTIPPSNKINSPYLSFPDGRSESTISGSAYGMDPTVPINTASNVGPPPRSGFVSKT